MPDHVEATPGRWLLDTIMEQWGRLTTHAIYTEAAQRGLDAAWSAGTLPGHPEHREPPDWRFGHGALDPWRRRYSEPWGTRHG